MKAFFTERKVVTTTRAHWSRSTTLLTQIMSRLSARIW